MRPLKPQTGDRSAICSDCEGRGPVKAGERIAACPEKSLGSELHASVSGTVSIDPDGAYIEIRTGKSWSYEKQEP